MVLKSLMLRIAEPETPIQTIKLFYSNQDKMPLPQVITLVHQLCRSSAAFQHLIKEVFGRLCASFPILLVSQRLDQLIIGLLRNWRSPAYAMFAQQLLNL